MRPLPSYEPLPPQPSVYDPHRDDFLSVLADDFAKLDNLNKTLSGEVDNAMSYESGIGGSIDAANNSLNDAISIFDALQAADETVDLTGVIADSLSLDNQLDGNLKSWAPDISKLAAPFLDDLMSLLASLAKHILEIVNNLLNDIWAMLSAIAADLGF